MEPSSEGMYPGVALGRDDRVAQRFATLYTAHAPAALRLAYALTANRGEAQDVVQDAFLRVFRRFADRKEPQDFERYLMATVINLVRRRARRRKREHEVMARVVEEERPATEEPDFPAQLWAAMLRLPVRQRAVIFLRYHQQMSEEEVAAALRCSVGAVKSMGLRARRTLKHEMEVVRDE